MIQPTVGFIVYGVHKDGLQDPMGAPFIDERSSRRRRTLCEARGLRLVEHAMVIATKDEARAALAEMKKDDAVDCVVLFSGTWVWAAHLIAAIRDFAMSGKAVSDLDAPRLAGLAAGRRAGACTARCWRWASRTSSSTARPTTRRDRQDRQLLAAPPTCATAPEHVHHRHVRRPRHGPDLRRGRPLASG